MKHNQANARLVRRGMTALLTLALVAIGSSAWALNKNEVLQLQASGLAPELIVQVIRASTDPVVITVQEVEELRAAGVGQIVLDEICLRIGGCGGAPVPGGGVPGAGVGPDLGAEIQRQQQLEQERLQMEAARAEQEREAMRQRIAEEQARNASVQQAFSGLSQADRAYDARRYAEAAGMYQEFLQTQAPDPNSMEYYAGLCGFVRAMHARGYRYSIRTQALEAVLYGPASTHFEEMFGILEDVANDAQFLDPRFESFADYAIGGLPVAFQDRFNFFLGRYFWQYNDVNRALAFFENVTEGAPERAKASYLAASMLLSEQRNSEAYGQFQRAIQAASATGNTEVEELSYLALARIAYEVGQYDAALYYYQKIDESSFRHPRAMFETMWTYYMKQDFERALGTLHTLHSPYYQTYFWPDLYVVEGAIYLQLCNLDEAQNTILAFHDRVDDIREETNAFIATAQPPDYWTAMTTYYDSLRTNDPIDLPLEAVRYVLSDAEFLQRIEFMGQLQLESNYLADDAAQLGAFGTSADAVLQSDLATKRIAAGLEVNTMVRAFATELDEWNVNAQTVDIEVSVAVLDLLDARLEGAAGGEAGTSVFVLAQDWQAWPFEGEYWIDEVDSYRGSYTNLRNSAGQCINPDSALLAPTE